MISIRKSQTIKFKEHKHQTIYGLPDDKRTKVPAQLITSSFYFKYCHTDTYSHADIMFYLLLLEKYLKIKMQTAMQSEFFFHVNPVRNHT